MLLLAMHQWSVWHKQRVVSTSQSNEDAQWRVMSLALLIVSKKQWGWQLTKPALIVVSPVAPLL